MSPAAVEKSALARPPKRPKQAGKALVRAAGDYCLIQFPDGGAKPLKQWVRRHQSRMRDGFGSHQAGRHKLG